MGLLSFLDRDHTVAPAGFNRWLVPPAALCIHLCIGEVYAFSVFNLPLTRLIGLKAAAPGDWSLVDVGWIFSVAILVLGLASAFTGSWLDRVGPRKAMTAAALCFGGGFIVGAIGISLHNLPLLFLGYGVLGGCGLGIGYISPVRTLITWFPDRPGMATGMAIMGFGGGAMIASPLSVALMHHYATPTDLGVAPTFVTLGIIYAVFMLIGAAIVRVPAPGWRPAGYVPAASTSRLISDHHYDVATAVRTPQFYLLWAILFLNVTAGIGVLSQASPMIQEMFHGNVTAGGGGGLRRAAQPVQHGRTVLLGLHLRLYRPQADVFRVLPARPGALRRGAQHRPGRQRRACSCCATASFSACMAAASPPSRPI